MEQLLALLGIAVMVGALFLIPFGLPGIWIMVAVLAIAAVAGTVGPGVLLALTALAGAAELLEFVLVRRMSARYGGSRRAFWGAILGGTAGVLVGMPVPIVGPLLAGVLGTFLGAAAAAFHESRHLGTASRVGWGAVLGRVAAVAVKTAAAVAIIVVGAGALLF